MRRPIFTGSKSMHAIANDMPQQPNMIRVVDVPMSPDENGLFTLNQVAHLASKRGCNTYPVDDYACELSRGEKSVRVMVTDRGLWSPVNVFRACREAAGQPHYEVNQATAKIKNPGGLDEVRIAEVIGADGVRPYLSRPGKYEIGVRENEDFFRWYTPKSVQAAAAFHALPKADIGSWTWPMFGIMVGWVPGRIDGVGKSYEFRRAVRTLDAAGLLKLTVGPRGDFKTATFQWLPLAYLQPSLAPEPKEVLDPVDADAMASLGA
jgi:hypothetical protein